MVDGLGDLEAQRVIEIHRGARPLEHYATYAGKKAP
jgi:hypothetical protein